MSHPVVERIVQRRTAVELPRTQLSKQFEALHHHLLSAYARHRANTSDLANEYQNAKRALSRLDVELRGPGPSQATLKNVAQQVLALEQQAGWDLADEEGSFPEEARTEELATGALKTVLAIAAAAEIPLRLGSPRKGL